DTRLVSDWSSDVCSSDLVAQHHAHDGRDWVAPGDVHLKVSGIPASQPVVGVVLSDSAGATWVWKQAAATALGTDPDAQRLAWLGDRESVVEGKSGGLGGS